MHPIRLTAAPAVATLLLAWTPFACGQIDTSRHPDAGYVFPSTANVQGAFGAVFKTRVVLHNPNGVPVNITATLVTPNGAIVRTINLPPNWVEWHNDFLGELGYTGGGGLLLVSNPLQTFLATAEVYADGPAGRFTTPVQPLSIQDKIAVSGDGGFSVATGLRANTESRANFGCANFSNQVAPVRAQFYSLYPTNSATLDFNVPANGWMQQVVPIQGEWIGIYFVTSVNDLYGVYCYGVTVGNSSNDGTAYPARWERTLP